MFDTVDNKDQPDALRLPTSQPPGVVVSPDTHRAQRVPPGQSRTRKWPVLDASGPPRIDMAEWRIELGGLIDNQISLTWDQFQSLPKIKVFSDFHCVTRWSRLGNLWEGVATREFVKLAGTISPRAKYVLVHGYDRGWTTNLPLNMFLSDDSLIATHHDGEPLTPEHGGPARLVVPLLYAWKSAKWISRLEFIEDDKPGFWERNGYHMNGNPWREERFGGL